jgi:hypothetical protein
VSRDPVALERQYDERLTAAWSRLEAMAGRTPPSGALTEPDPADEEQWDWGQVWAHVGEFPGYWLDQLAVVMAAPRDEPQPFGRTRTDPARIGAIEADRSRPVTELWPRIEQQLARLRTTLEGFTAQDWQLRISHPTLGVMVMPAILDRFLVGHLEEHAAQLEGLLAES